MTNYKPTDIEAAKLDQLFKDWEYSVKIAAAWAVGLQPIISFLKSTALANLDYNGRAEAMDYYANTNHLFNWRSWFSKIPSYSDGGTENIDRNAYVLAAETLAKNAVEDEKKKNIAYHAFQAILDAKDLEIIKARAGENEKKIDLDIIETKNETTGILSKAAITIAVIFAIIIIIKFFKK